MELSAQKTNPRSSYRKQGICQPVHISLQHYCTGWNYYSPTYVMTSISRFSFQIYHFRENVRSTNFRKIGLASLTVKSPSNNCSFHQNCAVVIYEIMTYASYFVHLPSPRILIWSRRDDYRSKAVTPVESMEIPPRTYPR
jgi:hypothetical protein